VVFPKKKIFYTKLYFVKKTDREEMEVEGERARRPENVLKSASLKPKLGGTKLI